MEFLKDWLISFASAAVIGTLFLLVSPDGALKKPIKIIVSLFVTLSFIYPLAESRANLLQNGGVNLDKVIEEFEMENQMKSEVITELEAEISSTVKSLITNAGAQVESVFAKVSIDENMNIKTESITVVLCKNQSSYYNTVRKIVNEAFGVVPEIKETEDEYTASKTEQII